MELSFDFLSIESIRLLFFFGLLFIFSVLELWQPRRNPRYKKAKRWPANLGISIVNTICLYILLPGAAIAAGYWAQQNHIGLFNSINFSIYIAWPLCFLALDLAVYTQHYLFHRLAFLWPFHAMHHSDEDLDVSSGIRFHPIEIIISMLFKCAVIIALGAPITLIMIFEIALNSSSLFTHTNVKLPEKWDNILRKLIVTPDMHRVHHSIEFKEQNSNFGFCFSFWDKIFKTYRAQPTLPHDHLPLGLKKYQKGEYQSLAALLKQPFAMFTKTKK